MKSEPIGLTDFLKAGNRIFYVPVFQRRYEWDIPQCEVLFKDIYETTLKNKENPGTVEHFIGSIVYVEEKGNKYKLGNVILTDGQQRITTILLFLAALRDVFKQDDFKEDLRREFLTVSLPNDKHIYPKLKQVESDGEVFKHIMLEEPTGKGEEDTKIYRHYNYFKNQIKELDQSGFDVSDLYYLGLDEFNLVSIKLEPKIYSWENPQDIFESMNSLGKPLSVADLVRNYLLLQMDLDDQEKFYINYWLPMETRVEKDPSAFIREYMVMKGSRWFNKPDSNNAKVLYSDFKSLFGSEDPKELLKDMRFYADIYAWITLEKEPDNSKITKILKDYAEMKINSALSLIMLLLGEWVKSNISDVEIEQMLLFLRSYFLRRRILAKSSAENKGIPALLPRIREEVLTAEDKVQALLDIIGEQEETMAFPEDKKIVNQLMSMNFYSSKYSFLILSMVEEAITKFRPVKDAYLQKEHIMPIVLSTEWKESLGKDASRIHDEYIHNIGNLTLIRHNQELGNIPFDQKKEIYSNNSGLEIAKNHIIECESWGEDQILERAQWLTDFIIKEVVPKPEKLTISRQRFSRKQFSFEDYNLVGKTIYWKDDPTVTAKVINSKQVKFEKKDWSLSGLTKELHERNGTLNTSGSYNGYYHWMYNGQIIGRLKEPVD